MALVIKTFVDFYLSEQDPRVQDWFLVSSPLPIAAVLAFYLFFVLIWGPKLMEKRQPFNIDKLLIVYNIIQISLCMYLVVRGYHTIMHVFNWKCAPVTQGEHGDFVASLVYVYYMIKVVDLLDTVFFVLRKKQNQVTFLHVYHHWGMVVLTFFGVKFVPGGHSVFMGYVNCIVHIVMYFYYLLTAYDKKFKYNIWFKRRITEMQLTQFFIFLIWYAQILFRENCSYPKFVSAIFVPQNLFMFVLFGDFYLKTYIFKKKKPVTVTATDKTESGKEHMEIENKSYSDSVIKEKTS